MHKSIGMTLLLFRLSIFLSMTQVVFAKIRKESFKGLRRFYSAFCQNDSIRWVKLCWMSCSFLLRKCVQYRIRLHVNDVACISHKSFCQSGLDVDIKFFLHVDINISGLLVISNLWYAGGARKAPFIFLTSLSLCL